MCYIYIQSCSVTCVELLYIKNKQLVQSYYDFFSRFQSPFYSFRDCTISCVFCVLFNIVIILPIIMDEGIGSFFLSPFNLSPTSVTVDTLYCRLRDCFYFLLQIFCVQFIRFFLVDRPESIVSSLILGIYRVFLFIVTIHLNYIKPYREKNVFS